MKILHTVEFYSPSVGGAQEVVRQISEQLVSRGHEVTVATTKLAVRRDAVINGVRIESFAISGNAVRGCTGEVDRYREFLRTGNFDIIKEDNAALLKLGAEFSTLDPRKAKEYPIQRARTRASRWCPRVTTSPKAGLFGNASVKSVSQSPTRKRVGLGKYW